MVEQAEGVEGVADDLGDGPSANKEQHAVLALHLHAKSNASGGESDVRRLFCPLVDVLDAEPCGFCSQIGSHFGC